MSTKIELTPLGSTEAQGCGDACGCGTAKAEPVVVAAPLAAPAVEASVDCRCGNSGEACCCADASCC